MYNLISRNSGFLFVKRK